MIYLGNTEINGAYIDGTKLNISSEDVLFLKNRSSSNISEISSNSILIDALDIDTYFSLIIKGLHSFKSGDKVTVSFDCEGLHSTTLLDFFLSTPRSVAGKYLKLKNGKNQYVFEVALEKNSSYITLDDSTRKITQQTDPIILSNFKVYLESVASEAYIGTTPIIEKYTENLLLDSDIPVENTNYLLNTYYLTDKLKAGEPVTVTIWGNLDPTLIRYVVYNSSWDCKVGNVTKVSDNVYSGKMYWNIVNYNNGNDVTNDKINIFVAPKPDNDTFPTPNRIDKIKLEREYNSNPVWTPSTNEVHNLLLDSYMRESKENSNLGIPEDNYSYIAYNFAEEMEFKEGDIFTCIINQPKVLKGEFSVFNVILYVKGISNTSISGNFQCDVSKPSNIINFKINQNITAKPLLLIYAGVQGSTRGNQILVGKVMLTKGNQPHTWKPAESELNLVKAGNVKHTKSNTYVIASYNLEENIVTGRQYTISICYLIGKNPTNLLRIEAGTTGASGFLTPERKYTEYILTIVFTGSSNLDADDLKIICNPYVGNLEEDSDTYVKWIVLQKGITNGVKEWIPSKSELHV